MYSVAFLVICLIVAACATGVALLSWQDGKLTQKNFWTFIAILALSIAFVISLVQLFV